MTQNRLSISQGTIKATMLRNSSNKCRRPMTFAEFPTLPLCEEVA